MGPLGSKELIYYPQLKLLDKTIYVYTYTIEKYIII